MHNISMYIIEKALEVMSDGGEYYSRKLAQKAMIYQGTAQRVLKLLHAKGFAEISSNGHKPYFYRITPKGREFLSFLKAGREGRCSEGDPRSTRLSYPGSAPARPLKGGEDADA
ncbi:hypothetical protein [Candidatus Pyrohabitans sp.]